MVFMHSLDAVDHASVEDANHGPIVVDCDRHWEFAFARHRPANHCEIRRVLRVDGEH